jgi:hypothetical protein
MTTSPDAQQQYRGWRVFNNCGNVTKTSNNFSFLDRAILHIDSFTSYLAANYKTVKLHTSPLSLV